MSAFPASPWLISGKYGNRGALLNMLAKCGTSEVLEGRSHEKAVSHVILCGVGSFDEGLRHIDESNLRDELMENLQNSDSGNLPWRPNARWIKRRGETVGVGVDKSPHHPFKVPGIRDGASCGLAAIDDIKGRSAI